MGPHHFLGGDMWIFPIMMINMFVVMLIVRYLIFWRRGFRPWWQDSRMKKARHLIFARRGFGSPYHFMNMFLGENEEKSWYAPASLQSEVESRPAQRSKTKEHLASPAIQAYLDKARTYKEQINNLIKSTSNQKVHARLQDLDTQVSEWVKAIEDIAKRVDSLQQNTVIHQDLESIPHSIENLEAQLANESDEATRIELEGTLVNRKNQLAALERLQSTINRAEIKIESILSALGTIYSQVLIAQSTNHVADYSHLSAEVDEEVRLLQDHLEALEEVKLDNL
jgi:hypothetical protein